MGDFDCLAMAPSFWLKLFNIHGGSKKEDPEMWLYAVHATKPGKKPQPETPPKSPPESPPQEAPIKVTPAEPQDY
jgi:hypothetical protein